MGSFAPSIESLIFSALLEGGAGATEKRNSAGPFLTVLAVFLFLAGLGFLLAGGYGLLADKFNPREAAMDMGGIALLSALIAAFAAHLISHFRTVRTKTYQKLLTENIRAVIEAVVEELEEPIRENPKTAAALAGFAGYAAARKFM